MLKDKVVLCDLWQLTPCELGVWVGILGLVCFCPILARNWRQADAEMRSVSIALENVDEGRSLDLTAASWRLNLNTATESELMLLPGVGRRRAREILRERQKGAFHSIWDLAEVPGMTKALIGRLEKFLRVEAPRALIGYLETAAPFVAAFILCASGACAAAAACGFNFWPGPISGMPLLAALLLLIAGVGILMAAWENRAARRALQEARQRALRLLAQRDVALLQARRLRAQAEGLALMREIHRSTAMPERGERLHRILTLLGDLFEAREVTLFAAVSPSSTQVQPAACLRLTSKEELFAAFELENVPPADAGTVSVMASAPGMPETRGSGGSPAVFVAKNTATIVREGRRLYVEGLLMRGAVPVGKVQWRKGAQACYDKLAEQDPAEILATALAKIDLSREACLFAAQALERRRTVRRDQPGVSTGGHGSLVLCVPLVAEQRPVGVLRVCRSQENESVFEEDALEETLLESAKHIALALKKDADDRQAVTDGLTGLYIKRQFLLLLEKLRTEVAADGETFSLAICDIDHFKKVNDTYGHLSGDLVLKDTAAVLRAGLRAGDLAFRYGGEEIALLLPHSDRARAEQTVELLRMAVQSAVFHGEKGQTVPLTISIGLAEYEPGMSGEALIGRADRALYASKQNGRNRVTSWSSSLSDPLEIGSQAQAAAG